MSTGRVTRCFATALVVIATLSVAPTRAHAQVEDLKITVDGMSCNLCAAGLERALRRVEGIGGVKVVLASQQATIRLKPGAHVVPARLRAGVEDAGLRLRVIEMRLRGTLERDGERYRLRPSGHAQAFAVGDDARLERLAGRNVRLRGRVVSSDAGAVELELVDVEPL